MNKARFTLPQLNAMSREEFVRAAGPVFELSPWIAEAAWPRRPFASVAGLHEELCRAMGAATAEQKLSLLRTHPDLVGRAALRGTLTPESANEQASAGLDRLTDGEVAAFQKFNGAYRERFGFPFIICARLNKKDAILAGFEARMNNSREAEVETALGEISKIAALRLGDLIQT